MSVKKLINMNHIVSIIIPMFNAENIIEETIKSILAQTFINWEMIIVDDCSTDMSYEYVKQFALNDDRIKIFQMEENSGPGAATKYGFEKSSGTLIAFIDSDDLWMPNKLQDQIQFMIENDCEFCCTDYEQINDKSESIGRYIKCKRKAQYLDVLHTNPIGSSTVIITRELLCMVDIPIIRKDNDYALWLRILKVYPFVHGYQKSLMKYRVWNKSISFNRFGSIKYHWYVYREYEQFSRFRAIFLIILWGLVKIFRIK